MRHNWIFSICLIFFFIIHTECYAQRRNVQPQHWLPLIEQESEPATPLKKIGLIWMDANQNAVFKDYDGNKQYFAGTNISLTNITNMAIDGNIIYIDGTNDSIGFFTTTPANESYIQLSDKFIICDTFTSAGANACIDALGSDAGEVYLPEGTYSITAPITIDYDNTTITGAGEGTILQMDSNCHIINCSGKDNLLIRNIVFNGNEATVDNVDDCLINISNVGGDVYWTRIENCTFYGFDYYAINAVDDSLNGNGKIVIVNCVFRDTVNTSSLAINMESTGNIINCAFISIDAAIFIADTYVTVSECKFISNDDDAIKTHTPNVVYGIITDNFFYGVDGYDIYLNSADSYIVSNNVSEYNYAGQSIYIESSTKCIISNNYCDDQRGGCAIKGKDSSYLTISSNTLQGGGAVCAPYGIYLDNVDNSIISSNTTAAFDTYGYFAEADCSNLSVYGNYFNDGFSDSATSSATEFIGDVNFNDEIILKNSGELKLWTHQDDATADDETINLPDATTGMIFACITDPNDSFADASGFWMVSHDGACSLVSGTAGTTAATDNDGDLCVYDGGTYGILKNRMGDVGELRAFYFYN